MAQAKPATKATAKPATKATSLKRQATCTVVVGREGKNVTIKPGETFEFTAEEINQLGAALTTKATVDLAKAADEGEGSGEGGEGSGDEGSGGEGGEGGEGSGGEGGEGEL